MATRPSTGTTRPGAVPTRPIGSAGSGRVACLRTPSAKSAYGRPRRSAKARAIALDLPLEFRVHDEVEPGRGREELDGPVVVRGPEASRDDAEIGLQTLAERGRELAGRVTDDRDPRRFEAERKELAREERAVQVGALAADELATGDDDRGAGPPGGRP